LRNSAKQVFKGGWDKTASATHTTNISGIFAGDPKASFLKPDGTVMFITSSNTVEAYSFGIPHDLNSINCTPFATFTITPDANPQGIAFSQDGTKMVVAGKVTKILYEYTLPVGYDIDSIVAAPVTMSLSMLAGGDLECVFSRDGDFVFVSDFDAVFSFPLPTLYDITSNTSNTNFITANVHGIAFKPEGDIMYASDLGAQRVREYHLSIINDITTATFVGDLDVFPEIPGSISIHSNGDELIMLDFPQIASYHSVYYQIVIALQHEELLLPHVR